MKSTIARKTEGYGYKYTELADINKYCEDNNIKYYQETETCEINQKDYIITYLEKDGKIEKHRGCQIVEATLQGIKNPVQEYGSSLTYCRRYSLLMALGLATEDDDGASLTQNQEPTLEDVKNYKLTFGKYKDKTLSEVVESDSQYLVWLVNNRNDEYLRKCYELLTGEKLPTEKEQDERIKYTAEINRLALETETDFEEIHNHFKVEGMQQMTITQMKECIKILEKKLLQKVITEDDYISHEVAKNEK